MAKNLDLIIKGNVITVVNQKPRAEAIGVKSGKIISVGTFSEVEAGAGKTAEVLDLEGKTILPGFIDSHAHPMGTGKNRLGVNLSSAKTVGEVLKMIRQRVEKTPPGNLIFCPDYNRLYVAEKRYPSRKELDGISTQHPIWIQHYDGHFSMVNSLALKMLGFTAGMEGVEVDTRGELTGLIQDPASPRPLSSGDNFSDEALAMEALMLVTEEAASVGITTLFAKEGLENAEFIMKNIRKIPVRIHPMVFPGFGAATLDDVMNSKYLGDHVCVCNLTDGSVEGRTAALYEPYADDPTTLGMLYHADDELYRFVEKVHTAGGQISIHAESDRAIDQVLWAYEKVLEKYPRPDHRHRIEHFEVPTKKQMNRVARLGVALAMQPMFITVCEGPNLDYYRALLGDERVKRTHPFRSILDEGILVSGGSDSPVTKMNPLGGMQACVNHPTQEQRIDVYEAIEIFTINGAKIGFEEDIKGSVEAGKMADFVVLSDDPYRVPREKIGSIKVEMTIVGGKVVYERKAA
jgi:predicted amidohydrolase YtcJ